MPQLNILSFLMLLSALLLAGCADSSGGESIFDQDTEQPTVNVDGYDYLNTLRGQAGMLALTQNAELQTAADNHVKYLIANTVFGHDESSGLPGFTGTTPSARVAYAGYSSLNVGEGIATGENAADSIDNLMSAIYHRFTLLNLEYDEIGMSHRLQTNSTQGILVHNMGNSGLNALCQGNGFSGPGSYYTNVCSPALNIRVADYDAVRFDTQTQNPPFVLWPPENGTDIPPAFYEETPDPLPNHSVSGYPVSVQFNPAYTSSISNVSMLLYDTVAKTYVSNVIEMDEATDPNNSFSAEEFALFPLERLEWNTRYRVEMNYTLNGTLTHKSWEFTTRAISGGVVTVAGTNMELSISNNTKTNLYFRPRDANDYISSYSVSYPPGTIVEIDDIDLNTVSVLIRGAVGDEIKLTLNKERTFTITLT